MSVKDIHKITDSLVRDLKGLKFSPPVAYVYNPLEYARQAYDMYLRRYGTKPREVLLVGMNPGPWGMAQTGVPFGEINIVKDWLGIETAVTPPVKIHPKRPITGFQCKRSEVSGRRLWSWARKTFATPDQFFAQFFVTNYCPLMFIEAKGRNRTPNQIHKAELTPLLSACDKALRDTVRYFHARFCIGVGAFAAARIQIALAGLDVKVDRITHPSPANPKANKGWERIITTELSHLGISSGISPAC